MGLASPDAYYLRILNANFSAFLNNFHASSVLYHTPTNEGSFEATCPLTNFLLTNGAARFLFTEFIKATFKASATPLYRKVRRGLEVLELWKTRRTYQEFIR